MRASRLFFFATSVATLSACSTKDAAPTPIVTASPTTVRDAASQFRAAGHPMLKPADATLEARDGALSPVFRGSTSRRSTSHDARVSLPTSAEGFARIEDVASGLALEVALDRASPSPAVVDRGIVTYEHALEGASLLHRPSREGTEDFLLLTRAPTDAISFSLRLGEHVAGLRLVARSLELLDAEGVPRLRMEAPYLVDASGLRSQVDVSIRDCAYDDSFRLPYDRAVTDPGARACTVTLSLDPTVAYPALLDPSWKTTGSMAVAHVNSGAAVMSDGRVLIAGGSNGADIYTSITDAEVYDPTSKTFTTVAPLPKGRILASLVSLDDGRVFVVGGYDGSNGSVAVSSIFDPKAGTFSAGPIESTSTYGSVAIKLADGRVLHGGGCYIPPGSEGCPDNTDTMTSSIFDPTSNTWGNGPSLTAYRFLPALATLPDGSFLLAGGDIDAGTNDTSETLDAAATAFTAAGSVPGNREGAR
jgi:hypothetical protein